MGLSVKEKKKWWFLSILLLFLFIASGCAKQVSWETEKDSGLLLGIKIKAFEHYPFVSKRAKYKTLYLTNKEGEVSLIKQDAGILVLKNDGFWSVNIATEKISDTYKVADYEGSFDYLVIKKPNGEIISENKRKVFEPGELAQGYFDPYLHSNGVVFDDDELIELTFVGENYLSYLTFADGYLGGVHGYATTLLGTKKLGQNDFLGISTIFNEAAQKKLFDEGEAYYAKAQDESIANKVDSEKHWGLFRENGKWTIKGLLSFSCQAARGSYALFDSYLNPEPEIIDHNLFPLDWSVFKDYIPEAKDVFFSPREKMLVVLTTDELRIYPNCWKDFLEKVYIAYNWQDIFDLQDDEEIEVVMAEWAPNSVVEQWAEELENYKHGDGS